MVEQDERAKTNAERVCCVQRARETKSFDDEIDSGDEDDACRKEPPKNFGKAAIVVMIAMEKIVVHTNVSVRPELLDARKDNCKCELKRAKLLC